ncbi:hypothetical protein PIB30_084936 [Stylosanthes scabra]|uniref:Uncharacterized protein n=1 Tax=Stylosanthes scabra TaxID=79078 RepID=A0ABU6QT76_9FABA|nr:hypothetical protein [Stylosanthes scabra]
MGFCGAVLDLPSSVHREQAEHGRNVLVFPLIARLNGLGKSSRNHHSRRILQVRNELDRLGLDDVIYMDSLHLTRFARLWPDWVTEDGETETWRATVPIVLFMFVNYHHVDRVKRQFGSEQPIPLDPVNLDGFLDMSAMGEDKATQLPDHVPPVATQPRDPIVLPHYAPVHGRRARQQRSDGEHTYLPHELVYEGLNVEIDFFTSADLEVANTFFQGEGSGTGTAPHAPADRPLGFQRKSPPAQMYELFPYTPDVMDQSTQGYLAAHYTEAPTTISANIPVPYTQTMSVYRPEPPI